MVLQYRRITLAVILLTIVLTVWLFKIVPMGFLPSEDTGRINIDTETAQGTSFETMKERQLELSRILAADPNIDGFMASVGGIRNINNGFFFGWMH